MTLFLWIVLALASIVGAIAVHVFTAHDANAPRVSESFRSRMSAIMSAPHDRFGKPITPYGGDREIARRAHQLAFGVIYRNHETRERRAAEV